MALWGNKDAVGSVGTVSLDYGTGVVTGSGTTFGQTGAAQVGDVIRFGDRAGTYFGDAVIVSIASTVQLTIGSTAGLSGASIASTSFSVSELPVYTVGDSSFSASNTAAQTLVNLTVTGTATTNAGVGTDIIPVVAPSEVIVGDLFVNGASNISISSIGESTVSLASTISVGISTGNILRFKRYVDGYDRFVYGVDATETGIARTTAYSVTHSGWVGITTYIDTHGNLRVKNEVLVAGGIEQDAADDTQFADS